MKCSISTLRTIVMFNILVSTVLAQDSSEQSGRSEVKLTPKAEAAWDSRYREVNKELAELDGHPWAGKYYHGDGLGVNATLTLAPESGFAFIWRGCLGVYDRNFGAIIQTTRGSLKLEFTYENNRKGFQGVAEELVPVAWGDRHYLIPFDKVIGFCNSINSQREPRRRMHGFYYLRRGDYEKPVDGAPELPEKYQAYLLSEPILAEVVAVEATSVEEGIGGWSFHKTKATLNVGRSSNVLPGMAFHDRFVILGCGSARVISVNENSCEVLFNQPATDKIKPTPPAVGWKLTTGSRLDQPAVPLRGNNDEVTAPSTDSEHLPVLKEKP